MNYKYTENFNIIYEVDLAQNVADSSATKWLWPRQDFDLGNWSAPIVFMLSNNYILDVGSNINNTLQFLPFSNCINAQMLIRAWDSQTSNKTNWILIDWIDLDQVSGTATINVTKISSVGTTIVGFQAQSFTMKYLNSIENTYTELFNTSITFVNTNWELLNTTFEVYIVSGEIKNYTLAFADLEEDNIYISTKSTPDLNIFKSNAQQQNQK